MDSSTTWETTDVVVCGGGPTGVFLSALLGRSSVSNVVLERELQITTDPRGIALDEDGIRAMQSVGLYDRIYSEMGSCAGQFKFISGRHHDLSVKPFMTLDMRTTEGGTGHVGYILHKQPVMEHHLRLAATQFQSSEIRLGCTLSTITEDENWVYVTYQDSTSNEARHIRCKFLVGADGKTGFVRKRYLEPRGVLLERASATPYEEVWVAINLKLTLPTPQTHPNFPLWSLGYTPEDVYDAYFPQQFRFLGNPDRPSVCGRFGFTADRLWRFEYVVQQNEEGTIMAQPDMVKKIVFPYLTHPRRRYKLPQDLQYPEDCIEILRSSPFTFSARSCNKWALGRVILCGDAAHVFPPFGGQGIVSGIRDSTALAWRLVLACRPSFTNYEDLLSAWYMERKQQLEASLAITIANGSAITERNMLKNLVRDWYLWTIQLVPRWKRQIEMGHRYYGMIRYKYSPGMAFMPKYGGGLCLPQVYCAKVNGREDTDNNIGFTDDAIFAPLKKGLFQVVVLLNNLEELETAQQALTDIDSLSNNELRAAEATFLLQTTSIPSTSQLQHLDPSTINNLFRLATGSEFAQSPLCKGRPAPKYYDEHRLSKETGGKKFVVLRPDYFAFAACDDKLGLYRAAEGIASLAGGDASGLGETEKVRSRL